MILSKLEPSEHLVELRPHVEKWLELVSHPTWREDPPWWYNERAQLSQLAGAIWQMQGWAFEEFATTKREKTPDGEASHYRGRGDFMFWTHHQGRHGGGEQFVAEAKVCFPVLGGGKSLQHIQAALTAARGDAGTNKSHRARYRRLAIVFVAPSAPESKRSKIDERFAALVGQLANESRIVAWHRRARSDIPVRPRAPHRLFPGTILIVEEVFGRG